MNIARVIVVAAAVMLVIPSAGCSKKKDEHAPGGTAVQQGQGSAQKVSDTVRDEVRAAAGQVLSRLLAGDFASVYKGAAPGFKKIGSEAEFVTRFQQARMKTGVLSNPQEQSFEARPNNSYVLVIRTGNDRYTTDWRLTLTAAPAGGYEISGLNQHDELK